MYRKSASIRNGHRIYTEGSVLAGSRQKRTLRHTVRAPKFVVTMAAALAIDDYVLALPNAVLAFAKAAPALDDARRSVEEQRVKFEELYRDAGSLSPDELEFLEKVLLERERLQAGILLPMIQDAEEQITTYRNKAHSPQQKTAIRLSEQALKISSTWLQIYQDLRIRLAKLASDKLAAEGDPGSPIISSGAGLDRYLRSILEDD